MKAKQLCVIIRAKTLLLSKEKAAASVHNFGAPGMIKAGIASQIIPATKQTLWLIQLYSLQ